MKEDSATTAETGFTITSTPPPHFSSTLCLVVGVVACLLALLGVVGNTIIILALLRDRRLRVQATTAFVVSLAVSDFLFCLINLPLTAARYIQQAWTLGDALCKIFPFFFYGNVAASLMSMVAITINRYILVSYNHVYRRVYSRFNIGLMLCCVWVFSFGMLVLPLMSLWGTLGLDQATFSCTIKKKNGRSPKKFLFIFGFLLPSLAIILCYSAIFLKVRSSRLRLDRHRCQNTPGTIPKSQLMCKTHKREDIKLTKTMVTIFLLFVVCFLPLMVVNVLEDSLPKFSNVHVISSMLAWTSATLNPLVYSMLHPEYKAAFKSLLGLTSGPCRSQISLTNSRASVLSIEEARRKHRPVQLQCLHSLSSLAAGLEPPPPPQRPPSDHHCSPAEHQCTSPAQHSASPLVRAESFSIVLDST